MAMSDYWYYTPYYYPPTPITTTVSGTFQDEEDESEFVEALPDVFIRLDEITAVHRNGLVVVLRAGDYWWEHVFPSDREAMDWTDSFADEVLGVTFRA